MRTVWIILGIIGVLIVLFILGTAVSGMMGYGWGHGMMGNFGRQGVGMMFPFLCLGGPLLWVLFIAGVIWLIATQVQKNGSGMTSTPRETPLDIIKARYAKGEITKEQFEEMKKDIGA